MDRTKMQYEGIKWLMELELVNHDQAINTIKFNILMISKRIEEAELLIYREEKQLLVLLHFTRFGRIFSNRQKIKNEVKEMLSQLLPSFRTRIIDDPQIMEMAVERVKKALTGGSSENSTNNQSSTDQSNDKSGSIPTTESSEQRDSNSETNSEEQTQSGQEVLKKSSKDDSTQE